MLGAEGLPHHLSLAVTFQVLPDAARPFEGEFHFDGPESSNQWALTYVRDVTETHTRTVPVEKTRLVPVERWRWEKKCYRNWIIIAWHWRWCRRPHRCWKRCPSYGWQVYHKWVWVPYTEYVQETYTDYVEETYTTTTTQEVANAFDLTIPAGESQIVTVTAKEQGFPEEYLLGDFSLSTSAQMVCRQVQVLDHYEYKYLAPRCRWIIGRFLVFVCPRIWPCLFKRVPVYRTETICEPDGESQTATAQANLVVPGDMMTQLPGATVWNGKGQLCSDEDPWQSGQGANVALDSAQSVAYSLLVQNVHNASVSYALREYRASADSQIVRFYIGGDEITTQMRSAGGYVTPVLDPGEQMVILVKVTPVGTSHVPQQVVIASRVSEIESPALSIASLSRFDAVKLGTQLDAIRRVQVSGWQEVY